MKKIKFLYQKYWPFLLFVILSFLLRLVNFQKLLFFTWDQGRDYFAVKQIFNGNLTLIGPTTGLQGFFLGPLWYYIGLIGFAFGQGSPFFFSLFYVLVTCSAIPLYWIFSKQLFKQNKFALLTAIGLSIANSSVYATTRVWNPMIAVPLMLLVFLFLSQAKKSRLNLWLGFLFLGFTLQAEFAYAVFFVAVLFPLVFWLRQKFSLIDYLIAGSALALTLVPQLLFELRHQFIMSQSLLKSFTNKENSIPWSLHFIQRPRALLITTKQLLTDSSLASWLVFALMFILMLIAVRVIIKKSEFKWKLLLLLALIPYPFFLIWKGNYGNFFDYYLTPHFIFLIPLVIYSLKNLLEKKMFKPIHLYFFLGMVFSLYYANMSWRFFEPVNNAGYLTMNKAIGTIYTWIDQDKVKPGVIRVFTPNAETEHYDALIHYQAKQKGRAIPSTVKKEEDKNWYILIEPDYQLKKRLDNWYREATASGKLTRKKKVGDLTIESWQKISGSVNEN
ncbi:MAG: hypothetical protein U9O78_04465 [Patescibacteria group bacterium]|nr:hypothetical protein [Patescibacteria group bacterium]